MAELTDIGLHIQTIIGTVLILAGTLLLHNGNRLTTRAKIDGLQTKVEDLTTQNTELSGQLTKSSLQLNLGILGSGYCVFGLSGAPNNVYNGSLQSTSTYNIYDLTMLITDMDKVINCKTIQDNEIVIIDSSCFFENTVADKLSALPAKAASFSKYSIQSTDEYKHIETKITTRHNRTLQQSVFHLIPNTYTLSSYKLFELKGDKWVLVEEENPLNLEDGYFEEHFLPIQNRKVTILP